MTDEELMQHLFERYIYLHSAVQREPHSLADLRRLIADQWNEAAHLVCCDTLRCQREHIETGFCETSYDLLEAKAEHLRRRSAALQQSREREQPDE